MSAYTTDFGSIEDYQSGGVMAIDDDPKNYVFSNIFEVAATSAPYERVAVGKNFEYVIEAIRAEGTSGWYTCAHVPMGYPVGGGHGPITRKPAEEMVFSDTFGAPLALNT